MKNSTMKNKATKNLCSFLLVSALAFSGMSFSSTMAYSESMPQQAKAVTPVIGPDFSDLAERLLPTVVNVSTVHSVAGGGQNVPNNLPEFPPGSPFDNFFKEFSDKYGKDIQPRQQLQKRTSALGSGFIIDAKKGLIVTNHHVIKGADEIKILLQDDTSIEATLVGSDEKTDIAVLKIKTDKKLVAAEWGDSDTARVGSWVVAIGNPFGLGGTVTAGIVSARQRDIHAGPYDDFIQSDASINMGNSGGPMFNTAGQVIGVNTAIFSPTGGSVGIGFAIPSKLAQSVVKQLVKYGKTKRGWLGVRIQIVTDEIAESLSLGETHGALIASITADGPAEKSGIQAGDIIIDFNGQKISQMRNLPRIVAETEVGKKVPVTLWRAGKKKVIHVTLGQLETAEETGLISASNGKNQKKDKIKPEEIGELGLKIHKLTNELRTEYGLSDEVKGVLILDVEPTSSAASKNIISGDIIVEFDQKPITKPSEIVKGIKSAQKAKRGSVLMLISRNGDLRFVALKLKKKN